jgi:DNA-binding NarL/FixJ family response regulator
MFVLPSAQAVVMAGRLFVLVVTDDPRLERQALCAVRAAGCLAMLGHADEDGRESLRRTRPDVVLLDPMHPCATSARFYEEAAELGVRVIALAPDGRDDQARAFARARNSGCVTLPTEYDLVPETLRPAELN